MTSSYAASRLDLSLLQHLPTKKERITSKITRTTESTTQRTRLEDPKYTTSLEYSSRIVRRIKSEIGRQRYLMTKMIRQRGRVSANVTTILSMFMLVVLLMMTMNSKITVNGFSIKSLSVNNGRHIFHNHHYVAKNKETTSCRTRLSSSVNDDLAFDKDRTNNPFTKSNNDTVGGTTTSSSRSDFIRSMMTFSVATSMAAAGWGIVNVEPSYGKSYSSNARNLERLNSGDGSGGSIYDNNPSSEAGKRRRAMTGCKSSTAREEVAQNVLKIRSLSEKDCNQMVLQQGETEFMLTALRTLDCPTCPYGISSSR